MSRLWQSFLVSLIVTLGLIGVIGFAVSRALVSPPPERLMTSLFQMDLNDGWSCDLEDSDWVCFPPGTKESNDEETTNEQNTKKKSTVAIIVMKPRDRRDTLKAYLDHLRKPKALTWDDGSTHMSEVKQVGMRRIGAYDWAEATHFGSELRNYYTHYLGTVTSHAAVLVSFSAHESVYDELNEDLEQMVRSLLVYQRPLGSKDDDFGSDSGDG